LESYGTTARYPFEEEGKTLVPSEAFELPEAKRCVEMADKVVRTLADYLEGKVGMSYP
jgi:HEPN domain-containing protein